MYAPKWINQMFRLALLWLVWMMVVVFFRVGTFEDDEDHVKAKAQPAKQLGRQPETINRSQFSVINLDLMFGILFTAAVSNLSINYASCATAPS